MLNTRDAELKTILLFTQAVGSGQDTASRTPKISAEITVCSTSIFVNAAAGRNGPFPEAIKHRVWGRC